MEVVQLSFVVVDIATVAEGIVITKRARHAAGCGQQASPGIIAVPDNLYATAIQDCNYVTLQICGIVIGGAIVNHRHGVSIGIIVKMQGVAANGHMGQLTAGIGIVIGSCPRTGGHNTAGTHTVGIVGKCAGYATFGHGGKPPTPCPAIVPRTVREGIADGVVGDGSAVIRSQQIAPLRITIAIVNRALSGAKRSGGVGVFPLAEDVACIVVCPHPRLARSPIVFPDQLVGTVVA